MGYCWSARFHWAKTFKAWVSVGFSKTLTVFFGEGDGGDGERLNLLRITSGGGCGVFGGLHSAEHDRVSVFPYCNRAEHDEKASFH